jgi:hypothetical protein
LVFRFATNDPVRFGVALQGNPFATEWRGVHSSYRCVVRVNSQNRTSDAEMKFDSRIGTALGMERQARAILVTPPTPKIRAARTAFCELIGDIHAWDFTNFDRVFTER